MTLWTSGEAAAATHGTATTKWAATGVSIDTRTLQEGDLFVALKDVRDGHEFVAAALEKGAAAALVTHRPDGVSEDAPLLIVQDVLGALEDLGRAARARTKARVVGITGSVGKTSTKEMLRDVLSAQGKTHASVASYNNHWGVPLTLARMPADTEFAVIEIGMNAPGEIAPLSRMAAPHVAMVTTVAAAHMEAFESLEGIAREKASIIDGLGAAGVAVLNADIETAAILQNKAAKHGAKTVLFGQMAPDFHLTSMKIVGDSTVVQAKVHGEPVLFKVMSAGGHFAMNALGSLAVVEALGADVGRAAIDMARWTPPAGRGKRERLQLDVVEEAFIIDLIDDAYNANPTSMAAALEVLAAADPQDDLGRVSKGRRIAILGDMLELGVQEQALHAGIADLEAMRHITKVHCVGPRMRALYEALPAPQRGHHVDSAQDLASKIAQLVDAGDVVLVKGSLGSKVTQIVDAIRKLGHPVSGQ